MTDAVAVNLELALAVSLVVVEVVLEAVETVLTVLLCLDELEADAVFVVVPINDRVEKNEFVVVPVINPDVVTE